MNRKRRETYQSVTKQWGNTQYRAVHPGAESERNQSRTILALAISVRRFKPRFVKDAAQICTFGTQCSAAKQRTEANAARQGAGQCSVLGSTPVGGKNFNSNFRRPLHVSVALRLVEVGSLVLVGINSFPHSPTPHFRQHRILDLSICPEIASGIQPSFSSFHLALWCS